MNIFSEYVRSVAFNLTLSRNQIRVLISLVEDNEQDRANNGVFVSGAKGLQSRGLIEHHTYPHRERDEGPYSGTVRGDEPAYTITEAGKKVYELLKLAGF